MSGIISYGSYVPYYRLQRAAVTAALGAGGGQGTRSVASYDEDTTSMGVEAARAALSAAPSSRPDSLLFATAVPAYADKTNATAIHAAVGLDESVAAYDLAGAVRSGAGALRLGLQSPGPTLVVSADIRTGLPGGSDEANGGDGAVAFLVGDGEPVLAELLAVSASSAEFLDRWRAPGALASRQWEERFGETAYVPLAQSAVTDALKRAGLTPDDVDHLAIAGLHARAARRVAPTLGVRAEAFAPDLTPVLGNTGTAHLGLALADILDRAGPGEVIVAISLADGADALVFRTTNAVASFMPRRTVANLVASGNDTLPYPTFLTWRGLLDREPPRRPDPDPPAAPPSFRGEAWKFAFIGSRCEECAARHLPPQRVCVKCGAADRMQPEPLADVGGTIATYTVDRLAYSLNPPVVATVVDFDGGGRFQCEMTDVDPSSVRIADRVEMTFRRLFTATNGIHNYFWKARPERGS
ncbi:MAG TPA: OB-fold domain-containing protein [Acidimicrobiales bacterium]